MKQGLECVGCVESCIRPDELGPFSALSPDRVGFMQACESASSSWKFSGGFRTWVKMSLVETKEEDGREAVEFRQEVGGAGWAKLLVLQPEWGGELPREGASVQGLRLRADHAGAHAFCRQHPCQASPSVTARPSTTRGAESPAGCRDQHLTPPSKPSAERLAAA